MQNPFEEMITKMSIMLNEIRDLKKEVQDLKNNIAIGPERISFTLQEAAELTGLSYHTIYGMVESGKMETLQPGGEKGKRLVEREELLRVLRNQEPVKLKVAR